MTPASATAPGHRPAEATPPLPPHPRARRWWSARPVTAALAASTIATAAASLLYEEVSVHTGHRADTWRIRLTDELAHRPVDSRAILAAALLLCALGLWLLALASTPGLRRLLPVQTDTADLRAVLDRAGAAARLQRAAQRVPGIRSAQVTLRRRTVKVRATPADPGNQQQLLDLLTDTLDTQARALSLTRPRTVRVTLRGSR